jgi:hypothetical protein
VGAEYDPQRRSQQEFINQLKDKRFASDIRPSVELVPLSVQGHDVDVLIIKNTPDTPYSLTQDYRDEKRVVRANYIYTRVRDTNTDIAKSADVNLVERLWRKRFGIDKPVNVRYRILLSNPDDWVVDWAHRDYAFNRVFPECQMQWHELGDARGSWKSCAAFFLEPSMYFATLKLYYTIPPKEFSPRYVARMRPQGVVRARLDPRQRIRIEEKQDSLEARAATTVSCPPAGLLCLTRHRRSGSLYVPVGSAP